MQAVFQKKRLEVFYLNGRLTNLLRTVRPLLKEIKRRKYRVICRYRREPKTALGSMGEVSKWYFVVPEGVSEGVFSRREKG